MCVGGRDTLVTGLLQMVAKQPVHISREKQIMCARMSVHVRLYS